MKIALDAMGGDLAPASPVAGAVEALHKYTDIEIILVGDQARIEQEFATLGIRQPKRLTVRHASQVVDMADSAIDAIRKKKDSSFSPTEVRTLLSPRAIRVLSSPPPRSSCAPFRGWIVPALPR
jgi:fatty acid/phospholipid biosynthesis enzyme